MFAVPSKGKVLTQRADIFAWFNATKSYPAVFMNAQTSAILVSANHANMYLLNHSTVPAKSPNSTHPLSVAFLCLHARVHAKKSLHVDTLALWGVIQEIVPPVLRMWPAFAIVAKNWWQMYSVTKVPRTADKYAKCSFSAVTSVKKFATFLVGALPVLKNCSKRVAESDALRKSRSAVTNVWYHAIQTSHVQARLVKQSFAFTAVVVQSGWR